MIDMTMRGIALTGVSECHVYGSGWGRQTRNAVRLRAEMFPTLDPQQRPSASRRWAPGPD